MSSLCCQRRGSVRALCAAAVVLAGMTSITQAQQKNASAPNLAAAIEQVLHVRNAAVANLQVADAVGQAQMVAVPFQGQNMTLDLQVNTVRDPEFQLLEQRADGNLYQVDPGPDNTFMGSVVGLPGSVVAGGLIKGELYVRVLLPDDREFWVEPIGGRVPGAVAGQYVIYTPADAIIGGDHCGNTEMPLVLLKDEAQQGGGAVPRGGTRYTAQLATDADWEFFQHWGGTTWVSQRISTVINTMNVQYTRDADIVHVISRSVVRTTSADPYTTTDPATLNAQIETEWNGQSGPFDVVQLFTGRDIDGSVIGRANHIGAICTGGGDPNCYVQSDFDGAFMSSTDLSAHELGHLWGGIHCTCSNPASTMNPFITSINRFTFSNDQNNIGQIVAYRNGRSCLTTAGGGGIPVNDDCADAVALDVGRFAFSNVGATLDGPTACNTIGHDIWYTYFAPCDGTLSMNTCENSNENGFDTILAAYTGSCSNLSEVACDDDSPCAQSGLRSSISFAVTRNTTYRIRVAGFNTASGSGVLTVSFSSNCPATPANDTCASAITISECSGTIAANNVGANDDGFVNQNSCAAAGSATIFGDLWYRYVAPCTGTVRVSSCGSAIDTKVAVYTSCPTGPNQALACNDDDGPACTGLDASVDFNGIAGSDYYIQVGSYSNITRGNISIAVNDLACPIPSNDSCSSPIAVSVGLNPISNVNSCNNLACGCGSGSSAVYYSFTAPGNCSYTVDTCGLATWDTVLAVYTSCLCINPIACNDDGCGGTLQSSLTFTATAGDTYLIRLAGFAGAQGTGQMRITPNAPSNDVCANAVVAGLGLTPLDNNCSNGEGSNGCLSGLASVFYSFTSPVTAALNISTCGQADFDTVLAVYANCSTTTPILCNDDACGVQSRVTLSATAGTTYIVRVSGFGGAQGSGFLRIGPDNDECPDALVISNGQTTVNINGATQGGANIGCLIPYADVWMKYTATCSGDVTIDTCDGGTNFDTVLGVYRGSACPVDAGRQVACNDDACTANRSRVTFAAAANQDFLVRLSNFSNTAAGTAVLNVSITCTCPCNWNHDAFVNSQDFFDFLTSFFASNADYNHDGFTNSQDFFDFLTCFFNPGGFGC